AEQRVAGEERAHVTVRSHAEERDVEPRRVAQARAQLRGVRRRGRVEVVSTGGPGGGGARGAGGATPGEGAVGRIPGGCPRGPGAGRARWSRKKTWTRSQASPRPANAGNMASATEPPGSAQEKMPRAATASRAAAAKRSAASATSRSRDSTMTSGRMPISYGRRAAATSTPPRTGLRGR